MNELYWITRFDSIYGFLIFLIIIFTIISGAAMLASVDEYDDVKTKCKRISIKCITVAIITSFIAVFIPSTKEALIIYGIGGTIDYVKSDSTAKQLPKKAILALDKYLNEITDDKN